MLVIEFNTGIENNEAFVREGAFYLFTDGKSIDFGGVQTQ